MSPRDLLQYVDVLRVLFGMAILMTYLRRGTARSAGRWFWFAVVMVVVIGLAGLQPVDHKSHNRLLGVLRQLVPGDVQPRGGRRAGAPLFSLRPSSTCAEKVDRPVASPPTPYSDCMNNATLESAPKTSSHQRDCSLHADGPNRRIPCRP